MVNEGLSFTTQPPHQTPNNVVLCSQRMEEEPQSSAFVEQSAEEGEAKMGANVGAKVELDNGGIVAKVEGDGANVGARGGNHVILISFTPYILAC